MKSSILYPQALSLLRKELKTVQTENYQNNFRYQKNKKFFLCQRKLKAQPEVVQEHFNPIFYRVQKFSEKRKITGSEKLKCYFRKQLPKACQTLSFQMRLSYTSKALVRYNKTCVTFEDHNSLFIVFLKRRFCCSRCVERRHQNVKQTYYSYEF